MNSKYIATGICGFAFILLWNALLIERDRKMFESYEQQGIPQLVNKCNPNCNIK